MDSVIFIGVVTAIACTEVLGALLYRGYELSRGDVVHHVHAYGSMRQYAGYAEDGVDRAGKLVKQLFLYMWRTWLVPFGVYMRKTLGNAARKCKPTAYLIRVYMAIRGLHSGHESEEGEEASSFLQEVQAYKHTGEEKEQRVKEVEE